MHRMSVEYLLEKNEFDSFVSYLKERGYEVNLISDQKDNEKYSILLKLSETTFQYVGKIEDKRDLTIGYGGLNKKILEDVEEYINNKNSERRVS